MPENAFLAAALFLLNSPADAPKVEIRFFSTSPMSREEADALLRKPRVDTEGKLLELVLAPVPEVPRTSSYVTALYRCNLGSPGQGVLFLDIRYARSAEEALGATLREVARKDPTRVLSTFAVTALSNFPDPPSTKPGTPPRRKKP